MRLKRAHDAWAMVVAVVLTLATLLTGLAHASDGSSTLNPADNAATTTRPHQYDSTFNLASRTVALDGRSKVAERRRVDAMGIPLPASGELSAPRGLTSVASGTGATSGPASLVRLVGEGESTGAVFNELKALTFETDLEHALVRLPGGQCAIVCGGQTGIHGLEIEELIAHTHPYSLPAQGVSAADYGALQQLGQQSSILLEHGQEIVFSQADAMFIKLFGGG